MSGLERTRAAARRGAAWLLPADRRDWVAAVWAEAHEVPPGLERLAWRVGGIWMLAPLGLGSYASNPWLRGSQVDPLVVLAWILLFGGPVAAGVLAARWYCRRPGRSIELARARIGQGFVAGIVANMVGALFVAVLGTGIIALMIKVAWLRPLVYHSPHPNAAAAYGHVLHASQHADSYITMCVIFPIIGLIMSAMAVAGLMPVPSQSGPQPGDGGGPPGPGPEPAPDPPPPGGRLADAADRVPVLS
jgi:hypothetical protein